MYKAIVSNSYRKSCVTRVKAGIMKAVMRRHGLAGPSWLVRTGLMLGTCATMVDDMIRIASVRNVGLPFTTAPGNITPLACSTALTKVAKVMYQKGITISKHGSSTGKPVAIETLTGTDKGAYEVVPSSGGVAIVYHYGNDYSDVNIHEISVTYTDTESILIWS